VAMAVMKMTRTGLSVGLCGVGRGNAPCHHLLFIYLFMYHVVVRTNGGSCQYLRQGLRIFNTRGGGRTHSRQSYPSMRRV